MWTEYKVKRDAMKNNVPVHCANRVYINESDTGVKLQGDWDKIVTLKGSEWPWEALRATKTSPSIFATFKKANTYAK